MTKSEMDKLICRTLTSRDSTGFVAASDHRSIFLAGMRAAAEYLTSVGEFGHAQDIISIADELGKP